MNIHILCMWCFTANRKATSNEEKKLCPSEQFHLGDWSGKFIDSLHQSSQESLSSISTSVRLGRKAARRQSLPRAQVFVERVEQLHRFYWGHNNHYFSPHTMPPNILPQNGRGFFCCKCGRGTHVATISTPQCQEETSCSNVSSAVKQEHLCLPWRRRRRRRGGGAMKMGALLFDRHQCPQTIAGQPAGTHQV